MPENAASFADVVTACKGIGQSNEAMAFRLRSEKTRSSETVVIDRAALGRPRAIAALKFA